MATALLEVAGLCAGYGDVRVLHEVGLVVKRGEIVCLIGSNGAGKTTLLRALSGVVPATAGTVGFTANSVVGLAPQQIVRRGIAHVPEGRRLFAGMSVRENLLMGAYLRRGGRAEIRRDLDLVLTTFRASPSGCRRTRRRSRAASNRCAPSAAASWPGRSC